MRIYILDVPIVIIVGLVSAYAYAKYLREKHPDAYVLSGLLVILLFWLNAVLSNLGVISGPWFTDRMVVSVNATVGIFYVLSYPLWFIWGGERSLSLFGRSKSQGGLLWPITLKDKTAPFKPAWYNTQDIRDKK